MLVGMIGKLNYYCQSLDPKTCSQLHVTEFGNMLMVIEDKGLLDSYEGRQTLFNEIENVFEALENCIGKGASVRQRRIYYRKYNRLLVDVKKAFGIAPKGNIQKEHMGLGLAVGSGLGVVLMTVFSPVMLTLGVAVGAVLGITRGKKKEKQADDEGKLF